MPTAGDAKKSRYAKAAGRVALAERAIQKHIDRQDSRRSKAPKKGAMVMTFAELHGISRLTP